METSDWTTWLQHLGGFLHRLPLMRPLIAQHCDIALQPETD